MGSRRLDSDTDGAVEIWTDGGCKPNPGPGGWAAILRYGDKVKELSGYDAATTNNRMELTAAAEALEALKRPSKVILHTDSEYVRNGITKWVHGWVRNNWRNAAKDPVANYLLWQRLLAAAKPHAIEWRWVKGHSGDVMNERADVLATQAREGKGG
ncbi:ribonuclease HI [Humitalea sp. 24SJ18S-53]|uniref:ribonuclease HI n=1 Tax=Humitalea sp. 24SJ18S-53 TaxID=3422307 RepID=UPI003D673F7E